MGISWAIYIYIYIFYNNLYNIIYNLYKSQWTWTDEVTIPQYQFTIQLCNHGCVDPSGTAPQGGGWVTVAPRDTCQQGNDSESAAVTWLRMESAGKKSAKYQPVVVCLRYFNFLNKFNNEHDTSWHLGIGMDHIATFAASEISNISRSTQKFGRRKLVARLGAEIFDVQYGIDWKQDFHRVSPSPLQKLISFFLKYHGCGEHPSASFCISGHLFRWSPQIFSQLTVLQVGYETGGAQYQAGRAHPVAVISQLSTCETELLIIKYAEFLWNPEENMWNSFEILHEIWFLKFPEVPLSPINGSEAEAVRTHPRLRSCHHLALGHRPKHRRWHGWWDDVAWK